MLPYAAVRAIGSGRPAHESSVSDAIDVKSISPMRRHDRFQFRMTLVRPFPYGPAQPPCDSVNVTIHGKNGRAARKHENALGHFVRHAGQGRKVRVRFHHRQLSKFGEIARTEIASNLSQRRSNLLGFNARKTGGAQQPFQR